MQMNAAGRERDKERTVCPSLWKRANASSAHAYKLSAPSLLAHCTALHCVRLQDSLDWRRLIELLERQLVVCERARQLISA